MLGTCSATARCGRTCASSAGVRRASPWRKISTRTSLGVILLESGGTTGDEETQSLYEGHARGLTSAQLVHGRLRYLGGGTNHWAGMCRPFEPLDFQARPWVPHSGWPLSRDVLEPYYRRAHLACGLEPDRYDDRAWNRYLAEFDRLRHGGVLPKVVQLTLVQFGRRFRPLLERSQTVRLLLHANAHELLPDPAVGTVRRVEVRTLSGNHFFVEARAYVLACGGIENARILLASDSVTAKGLGNGRDLVGRFYMDHPATESCALALFFDEKAVRSLMEAREKRALLGLTLSDAVQREQGLTSNVLYFTPPKPWKTFWMETVHGETAEFLRRLGQDRAAYGSICRMLSEQVPNPDSRVTLTQERDRLGMRRVLVDSRLHDLNRHTSWTAPGLYARGFARGYVNPTLTIVALSLRLAEHLRRVLV